MLRTSGGRFPSAPKGVGWLEKSESIFSAVIVSAPFILISVRSLD